MTDVGVPVIPYLLASAMSFRMSAANLPVQARLKLLGVHPDRLCVARQHRRLERLLILEESVVHFPVFVLLARAVCRLRRLEGVLVDRFERRGGRALAQGTGQKERFL
jgi:hypothetical protein